MRKHHPDNERLKHKYFVFLKEAKRQNEASVDAVAKAISRFEKYTKWKDFKAFHVNQARGFKAHLAKHRNARTGAAISKATMNSTLRALKAFFQWVALQPGYKSRVSYTDAEYLNLPEKDVRIATAKRQKAPPTLEQVKRVIAVMPNETVIERRNRALMAFTLLTGARDSAIASIKLKHVDFEDGSVFQDAREVRTKASKTFTTWFFPVGNEVRQIVWEWMLYLKEELLFGLDDPLFPKTDVQRVASGVFEPVGISRAHWNTATPIRKIFKEAFERANSPYFNPHSFRKTLAVLGESVCQSPEAFKAWSQNLGHEGVLTTFLSYGEVQPARQSEIFKTFQRPHMSRETHNVDALARALAREMKAQDRA